MREFFVPVCDNIEEAINSIVDTYRALPHFPLSQIETAKKKLTALTKGIRGDQKCKINFGQSDNYNRQILQHAKALFGIERCIVDANRAWTNEEAQHYITRLQGIKILVDPIAKPERSKKILNAYRRNGTNIYLSAGSLEQAKQLMLIADGIVLSEFSLTHVWDEHY